MSEKQYKFDLASSKGHCSQCKKDIAKGEVRITFDSDKDDGKDPEVFHVKCKSLKSIDAKKVDGFDKLSSEHQTQILDQAKPSKGDKDKDKKDSKDKDKEKKKKDDDSDDDEHKKRIKVTKTKRKRTKMMMTIKRKRTKKRAARMTTVKVMTIRIKKRNKRRRRRRRRAVIATAEVKKTVTVTARKTTRRKKKKKSRSKSKDKSSAKKGKKRKWEEKNVFDLKTELKHRRLNYDQKARKADLVDLLEEDDKNPQKRPKKKNKDGSDSEEEEKKKKKPRERTVEEKDYQALKKNLDKKTMTVLKDELRHNNQRLMGQKKELVERVADGRTYGTLPKCPDCRGGLVKIVYPKRHGHGGQGKTSCSGFMDDGKFVRCSYKSDKNITRAKWKIPVEKEKEKKKDKDKDD